MAGLLVSTCVYITKIPSTGAALKLKFIERLRVLEYHRIFTYKARIAFEFDLDVMFVAVYLDR